MMSGISAGRTWTAKAPERKPRRARSAGRTSDWRGALTGVTGRKVSTQRKHAFVFAGSDVREKCKRITLTLSSVLTYRCMYVGPVADPGGGVQGVWTPPFWATM